MRSASEMLKRDSPLRAQVKEITEREQGAGLFAHRAPAKERERGHGRERISWLPMVLTAFAELPGRMRLSLLGVMAAFLTALGECSSNHACAGALADVGRFRYGKRLQQSPNRLPLTPSEHPPSKHG